MIPKHTSLGRGRCDSRIARAAYPSRRPRWEAPRRGCCKVAANMRFEQASNKLVDKLNKFSEEPVESALAFLGRLSIRTIPNGFPYHGDFRTPSICAFLIEARRKPAGAAA